MVRFLLPIVALALGATAAFGLLSCGGRDEEGLLPGDTAQQILDNLDQVEADASNGDCSSAAAEVGEIQDQIENLPSSVDSRLRDRLTDGADSLEEVVNSPGACETTTEETITEPTTTEETTTEETTTEKKKPKTTTTTVPTIPTTTEQTTTTAPTTPTGPPTGGTPGQSGGSGPGGPG